MSELSHSLGSGVTWSPSVICSSCLCSLVLCEVLCLGSGANTQLKTSLSLFHFTQLWDHLRSTKSIGTQETTPRQVRMLCFSLPCVGGMVGAQDIGGSEGVGLAPKSNLRIAVRMLGRHKKRKSIAVLGLLSWPPFPLNIPLSPLPLPHVQVLSCWQVTM